MISAKKIFNYINLKKRRLFSYVYHSVYDSKIIETYRKNRTISKIEQYKKANLPLKIIIGSEGTKQEGWIATDEEFLNLLKKEDFENLFGNYPITRIVAEHVWEHLDESEGITALRNCYNHLAKGGQIRIAVPDGYNPDKNYIKYVGVGALHLKEGDHKILYNYKTLTNSFTKAGFRFELLEYFDENGQFHRVPWQAKDGFIVRSADNDPRNQEGVMNYTSLIIDGIK